MTAFLHTDDIVSWGRAHRFPHRIARPAFRDSLASLVVECGGAPILAVGFRRSYGDSCLNANGALIDMTGLDRIIAFDPATGILEAEAGISLRAILAFAIPRGFFLSVVPGTQDVTLGGAIANDVHGKNHLRAGSFGNTVATIDLLRTDGSMLRLTPDDTTGRFAATVGGLGLTGIITAAAVRLRRVTSTIIETASFRFRSLPEYFALAREHAARHEFSVAWIELIGGQRRGGSGIFSYGDFAGDGPLAADANAPMALPFGLPSGALRRGAATAFNAIYRQVAPRHGARRRGSYRKFLFPLDGVSNWNQVYGRAGMFQHQSAFPPHTAEAAIAAILNAVEASQHAAFMGVLKSFGGESSGLMSFPMEGTTIALDFPNLGELTRTLLSRLNQIVVEAGGRVYSAKEGCGDAATFVSGYPAIQRFSAHLDAGLSSSFWRRVAA